MGNFSYDCSDDTLPGSRCAHARLRIGKLCWISPQSERKKNEMKRKAPLSCQLDRPPNRVPRGFPMSGPLTQGYRRRATEPMARREHSVRLRLRNCSIINTGWFGNSKLKPIGKKLVCIGDTGNRYRHRTDERPSVN